MVKAEHSAARALAERIERGLPFGRAAASIWARLVRLDRPLRIPRGVRVVTVGGATLGGSGKTPVAVAVAGHLARTRRTALVSHAYGAKGRVGWVMPGDDPRLVGDEAVASAEELAGAGARVVSARRRQDAVDLASTWAETLVIDGPLQLWPRPADVAILALSADTPWGSGACPPVGDLRAPKEALLARADFVVETSWSMTGARTVDGCPLALDELRRMSVGLVTNVARPERIVRTLARAGIHPIRHVALADHASVSKPPAGPAVDLWLAPTKTRPLWRGCRGAAWLTTRLDLDLAHS